MQRLRKSVPRAKRRDTVCAKERSAFRKRLRRECVVGVKQGYRRRKYACPVCGGRENGNQVHDDVESRAWSDIIHLADKWWRVNSIVQTKENMMMSFWK